MPSQRSHARRIGAEALGACCSARIFAAFVVVFLFLCISTNTLHAAAPAGDWWDTSFTWRRKVTLSDSGSGTPTGEVASITINHAALVSASKSQADGDDLRLAYWNGTNWTELPRVLASGSSWNSASTQIMFRTSAAIGAGGSSDNYYLYFGNSLVTGPATGVPTARWFKTEQLVEQSTTSSTFVDVPSTTLTFTPGSSSETWLIFVSGVIRSNSTAETSVEMRLLIGGVETHLWGHQNNGNGTPNGAGFFITERITGVSSLQTIQPQFRAAAGTSFASSIRVVAALIPPGADFQFAETDATTQQTGTNLSLQSLTFTPSSAGDYLMLGNLSQHETPGGSTAQCWVQDDAGTLHPNAPTGTRYSNARAAWNPFSGVFRRTLPASSRTFTLRGTSSASGTQASEWRYRRLLGFRTDAWESVEYNESLGQSATTSTTFQVKNSLTTTTPPAARDYLILQVARIAGNSTSTTAQKAGELRDGGTALVRTNHRIDRDGTDVEGYHHIIGVGNAKRTAASVTYENGFLSPSAVSVECAESTICALRYHDPAFVLGTDEATPTVAFTAASQSGAENVGTMTAMVELSAVSGHDVSVPFTVGGTAASPTDYTISSSPVVIPAGALSADITITVVNNQIDDTDKTVVITLGTPTNALVGTTNVHTATITDDDSAGITVTPTSGLVTTEAGGTATFTVVLDSQPTADVTIGLSSSNTTEGTVSPSSLTFTSSNWDTPRTVTLTGVNDFVQDSSVGYTIVTAPAVSTDSNYDGFDPANVTASNTDNDTAGITVTPTSGLVTTEAGGTATFTVVLDSQPTADVSIGLNSSDATEGTVSPSSLIFTSSDWSTPKTVTVTGVNDFVQDGSVTYTIVTSPAVSADSNYNGLDPANVSASNTDNDSADVTITESGGSTNVTEGGAADTYSIVLTTQPLADVTITVDPDSQTSVGAGAGVSTSLTFTSANWNTPQVVSVTSVDDAVAQGPRTSTITHSATSADSNYDGITIASVIANVSDDDVVYANFSLAGASALETAGSMMVDVTLSVMSTSDVTIPFTIGGTASSPSNYTMTASPATILAGQLSATITITIIDNFINNPDRTVILTMGNPTNGTKGTVTVFTATIMDNEPPGVSIGESGGSTTVTEGGATDSYAIVLQSQPLSDVTVSVNTDGKTTTNPTSFLFTPSNWNSPRTITVTAVDNAVAEGSRSSTITHTATSADSTYDGISVAGVTALVVDNDTAGVTITESGGSTNLTEGGSTDNYTVVLDSQPTADVTITVTPDSQTNIGGGAGAAINLIFTNANWNSARTVTVTAVDDALPEGPHISTITHTAVSADSYYNGIGIASVTAHITDNDTAGITVTPTSGLVTTEAGGTATFTVALDSQPTANVTIGLSSNDTTEGTVSPSSITFTSSNWNTPRMVTLTGANDFVHDGNAAYTIVTAPAVSADSNYNGIDPANVAASNTDNDSAGVTITESGGSTNVTEGGEADTYSVVLISKPTADVVVTVTPDAQSSVGAGAATAIALTFTDFNWNTPQTVSVTAIDDIVVQGSRMSTISHTAASADSDYDGIPIDGVVVSITDDDAAVSEPQVSVTIQSPNHTVIVGDSLMLVVTVSNDGANAASTLRLLLPTVPGVEFGSAYEAVGAAEDGPKLATTATSKGFEIALSDLPSGESLQVNIHVRALLTGELAFTAAILQTGSTWIVESSTAAHVTVEDEYVVIVTTSTPVHLCGSLGAFSFLFLGALLGLIWKNPSRACAGRIRLRR